MGGDTETAEGERQGVGKARVHPDNTIYKRGVLVFRGEKHDFWGSVEGARGNFWDFAARGPFF